MLIGIPVQKKHMAVSCEYWTIYKYQVIKYEISDMIFGMKYQISTSVVPHLYPIL